MNAIPPMTHEYGKHWNQPSDIRTAPMDGKLVLLTRLQFRQLSHYETSIPSGVYEGKCWKRRERRKWYLFWYGDGGEKNCTIEHREIRIGRLNGGDA